MSKINVNGSNISFFKLEDEDYLSLTDMLKTKDGDFFVSDWLRNRNTLEFGTVIRLVKEIEWISKKTVTLQ